jgi:hypothetical protein
MPWLIKFAVNDYNLFRAKNMRFSLALSRGKYSDMCAFLSCKI